MADLTADTFWVRAEHFDLLKLVFDNMLFFYAVGLTFVCDRNVPKKVDAAKRRLIDSLSQRSRDRVFLPHHIQSLEWRVLIADLVIVAGPLAIAKFFSEVGSFSAKAGHHCESCRWIFLAACFLVLSIVALVWEHDSLPFWKYDKFVKFSTSACGGNRR